MPETKSKTGLTVTYIKHVIHYKNDSFHATQKCICDSRNLVVVAEHDPHGYNGYYCLMCDSYWTN